MAESTLEPKVLRVLVVLDPSAPRSEVLEALACLTGGRAARLTGLFVEDADLLSLARLPFAREVRLSGGPVVRFDTESLSRALESQAERVRQLFESASSALRLASSFRVVRGNVQEELERAAQDADLLVIGRAGRRAGPRNWQSQVVGRLPRRTHKTVVYVQESWRTGRTVVAYHDGDSESRSTLELAVRVANLEQAPLLVIVPAGENEAELRRTVERELVALEARAPVEIVEPLGSIDALESWRRLLLRLDARVLVVPAGHPEIDDRLLGGLLERMDCSLVVVNEPGTKTA